VQGITLSVRGPEELKESIGRFIKERCIEEKGRCITLQEFVMRHNEWAEKNKGQPSKTINLYANIVIYKCNGRVKKEVKRIDKKKKTVLMNIAMGDEKKEESYENEPMTDEKKDEKNDEKDSTADKLTNVSVDLEIEKKN
jgi:hypothetical protein